MFDLNALATCACALVSAVTVPINILLTRRVIQAGCRHSLSDCLLSLRAEDFFAARKARRLHALGETLGPDDDDEIERAIVLFEALQAKFESVAGPKAVMCEAIRGRGLAILSDAYVRNQFIPQRIGSEHLPCLERFRQMIVDHHNPNAPPLPHLMYVPITNGRRYRRRTKKCPFAPLRAMVRRTCRLHSDSVWDQA